MINNSNKSKIIFHIDLNAFFATVAAIINPYLKGKAFAIGRANSYRGVLSTASYEARKYGINSGMPVSTAIKTLPSLIVVNPDFRLYQEYHNKFISLLRRYSDTVEVLSIDEAFVDMTKRSMIMHPVDIALEIQRKLLEEYQLPCSIGIAPTLFLAKMASDIKKPMGLTVLRKREISKILYPLGVKEIYGIGKKTWPVLIDNNIKTIGDFMNPLNEKKVLDIIGLKSFLQTKECLDGLSTNKVIPNRYAISDSISNCATYDNYLSDEEDILIELRKMAKGIHQRMVSESYLTKTISITLRDSNFETITRSKSIDYTNDLYVILDIVADLLEDNYKGQPLRLIGVGFSNLVLENELIEEYNLFTFESIIEKEEALKKVIEEMKDKFGENIINKGIK